MNLAADLLDLRYDGGGHVESFFFKAAEPGGRRAVWTKVTVLAQAPKETRGRASAPPVAEAWCVVFDREKGHVATKTTLPLERARFARGTLDVEVDGCELSLGRARGDLATGLRRIAWDLAIGPSRAEPVVHLPSPMLYAGPFPASKLVSPVSDARATGSIRIDRGDGAAEESWDVSSWPAMIGHNWGRTHARLYAWTHCSSWDDAEDLVFEAVSARVRMGPVLSPMATAAFVRWRGQRWDLNTSELFGKNRGNISMRRWEATCEGHGVRLHAELAAETDAMVGLHYPNPSGAMTYCLNSGLARARLELALGGGRTLVATSRAATLEIGTRDRDHGVPMYL